MVINTVVPQSIPHKHKAGVDRMITRRNGNALIMIDESYIENRTEEQHQLDLEQLQDAAWAIIDELVAAGEEV